MAPPKLSGAQNRKKRKQQKFEDEKAAKTMAMFLKKDAELASTDLQCTSTEDLSIQQEFTINVLSQHKEGCSDVLQSEDETVDTVIIQPTTSTESPQVSQSQGHTECAQESSEESDTPVAGNTAHLDSVTTYQDVGLWPRIINSRLRDLIVLQGPQPLPPANFVYPKDHNKRHFSGFYGFLVLPNKEQVPRRWVQYSLSTDRIYCFCCKLFDPSPKSKFGMEGINKWQHIGEYLTMHESSPAHISSHQKWIHAENNLKKVQGIDKNLQTQMNQETKRWRDVLERIMAVTQFLASNNLPFRGSSNKLNTPNNGNFLGLIQLLAKFEPVMKDHIQRIMSQQTFVHYCGNRWCIISDHVKNITLKKVCATRWECRVESLKAVRYQYTEIYEALIDLEENTDDPKLSSEAKSLSLMLQDFSFLLTVVIWYDVLFQVNIVSKEMQSRDMELTRCNDLLKNCTQYVRSYRSSGLNSAKITASEIALDLGIEACFIVKKRPSKKKRMFDYESQDEPVTDPEQHYKVSVFYPLIDNMTESLETRFLQLSRHNKQWGFLYNILDLPVKDKLLGLCKDLEQILSHTAEDGRLQHDINGIQLCEELQHIQPTISKDSIRPLEVLQHIQDTQCHDLFPNIWIAMRILLTIPVTVANCERSFSKLKLIKTYLRSTMSEDRLSALAILSIESEMAKYTDYSAAIDAFAAAKSRKVNFV
ncbi:uncharacterized protein LOC121002374 [Bufo bufo]|uniref:uncharacterized protein LOC120978083 n=1 Tax=Bufo bufo TaxID=8384 RepID=UPI001ABE6C76|nr:uncharacterized protein LOC120978083 [Bufo bufo]XP_040289770.1 uncharacterized protein LOC121002374 [Bufo bufo]